MSSVPSSPLQDNTKYENKIRKWKVTCGTLKAVCMSTTAYGAAKESLAFATPNQELGDYFLVAEIITENGETYVEDATLSYLFESICEAAGWEVE